MNNEKNEKVSVRILRGVFTALLAAVLAVFVFVVMNY